MSIQNTKTSWGGLSRAFHWSIAFLMLAMLVFGFWMVGLEYSPAKLEYYTLHKSVGLTILGLGALRLLWRFMSRAPDPHSGHAAWERFLSKSIHIVLYGAIFLMPLSGWVMSSAGAFPISFFGLFDVPDVTAKNEAVFRVSRAVHWVSALVIIGAVGLHIMGALKHHVIDRDDTLRLMGGNFIFGLTGLVLLGGASYFALPDLLPSKVTAEKNVQQAELQQDIERPSQSKVQEWSILREDSHIEFTFEQYGKTVSGFFENWGGEIVFDPDNLEESYAKIQIDIGSIKTGSEDRDAQALRADWFDVDNHPQAVFESESFEALEANRFTANGVLKLRGIEKPLSFPFALDFKDDQTQGRSVTLNASLPLERLAFGIGQNQWERTDAIANEVMVNLKIEARADP